MKQSMLILSALMAVSMMTPVEKASANEERLQSSATQVVTDESLLHFSPVETSTLTTAEKSFVEEAKMKKPGIYHLGNLYVITLGQKPSTAYNIKFVESKTTLGKEQIFVEMTTAEIGGDAITYPHLVGRLQLPSKYMSVEVIDVKTGKSAFEEKDPFTAVAINKEWTIRFNTKIKRDTITNENIYIYEKANGQSINKFPVKLTLLEDGQSVKVTPLASYKYDHNYKLFISKEVSSTANIKMKEDKEVTFTTVKAPEIEVPPADPSLSFNYKFRGNDTQGWQGEFSDYDKYMEIEPIFKYAMIPSEIGKSLEGLYMSSSNRSDDVFMYIKKKLDTQRPHTRHFSCELGRIFCSIFYMHILK